jgi:sensor histidine kinase YesM
MRKKVSTYWLCQFGGWGSYGIVYTIFYFAIRTKPLPHFFHYVLLDVAVGIGVTHLMRLIIIQLHLLDKKIRQQILFFAGLLLLFSFLFAGIIVSLIHGFKIEPDNAKEYSALNWILRYSYVYLFFLLIWNLIYVMYHYVEKNNQQQLDKIKLEAMVKELELKTIKSHINPHFIFNALNSIRALVDENPERARTAITELSNLLRNSMQTEKLELTSLEKELGIVKDYLALEFIRFEDRLKVEYHIDDETLDQPVPPMMLQTLVENAIKHGISKQIDGGVIRIISDFKDDRHELIVQNSGKLSSNGEHKGFGIESTVNRLKILYGNKAAFELKNFENN